MANVYRADHVGALIKPESVLTAQKAFAAGQLDAASRTAAEDAAIVDALAHQKSLVMTVVTDGEFRRADSIEPYARSLDGITRGGPGAPSPSLKSDYVVNGKLKATSRLAAHESAFLTAKNQTRFKICLASPSTLALRLFRPGVTDSAYPTVARLAAAFGDILRSEITALLNDGVPYVQLNGGLYHALFEGAGRKLLPLAGNDRGGLFDELVSVDVAAIRDIPKSSAATIAMSIGRVAELEDRSDRYERMVASLLEQLPVDRVLLEYDEPQDHDFASLAALRPGQMAVLGLVRTDGQPEDIGDIIDRIERAAKLAQEDHLALSPRRSFFNDAARPLGAQLKQQEESLLRASEVVQQFWGLEL
jgi:5-methyltetrahydropteroyltriglutamate--homocysteine methyltransferase